MADLALPRPGWVRGACTALVVTLLYVLELPLLGSLQALAVPSAAHLARGILFSSLVALFGCWAAAHVAGFLWAGALFVAAVVIPFAMLGMLLAFVRQRTGSVLPGMLLHGVQNSWAAVIGASAGWYMAPM